MTVREPRRRASAGYTYDPCQGCGDEAHRKKGTLCYTCTGILNQARAVAAHLKEATDQTAVEFVDPRRAYDLADYFAHPGDSMSSETSHLIQGALVDLVYAVATVIPEDIPKCELPGAVEETLWSIPKLLPRKKPGYAYETSRIRLLVPTGIVEPLRRLDTALLTGLGEVAIANRLHGQQLLLQLADGSLSLTAYEKQTLK